MFIPLIWPDSCADRLLQGNEKAVWLFAIMREHPLWLSNIGYLPGACGQEKGPRQRTGGGLELRRTPGRRERRRGIDLDQNL